MTTTPFALTPGQIEAGKIVDMNSKQGRELYHKAIQPLKVPFDGDSKNINMFQSQLLRKVEIYGWDASTGNILSIPDAKSNPKNFITEYGCLTKTDLVLNAADFVGITNRKAQNNHMMVECMLASIDEACFYKISNEQDKYTITGVKVASLLYKLLMAKAIVDTRATTYQFRNNLANLDNYMTSVNSNIEMFNIHVKNTVEGLKARGESVDDLMMLLFKGYKAASDSKFIEYISTKEERYLDDIKGDTLDWEQLMQLSLNKFTMRRDNGEWETPTEE